MSMRFEDIADWLLEVETGRSTLVDLTDKLVQKIEEVGVPLSRLNLAYRSDKRRYVNSAEVAGPSGGTGSG
jgi:hypothetical protein